MFVKSFELGIACLLLTLKPTFGQHFTVGYLTGSQRRFGDLDHYARPGTTISGAITLAVEEINEMWKPKNRSLSFIVAETYGDETTSIRKTATLVNEKISAYIGPQESCVHEGRIAAAFNLPMISYYCMDHETSNKVLYPTFARTKPPDIQISKSVTGLLRKFNWTQITFFYSADVDGGYEKVGVTIASVLLANGIKILQQKVWNMPFHYNITKSNPFVDLVKDTYEQTRIFVILGNYYEHIGLLLAMKEMNLFEKGEYFVVGIDIEPYKSDHPEKYMKGLLFKGKIPDIEECYKWYMGVFPSPSKNFPNFSQKVNQYLKKPPFNFTNLGKTISIEAAYLYDAVHLYAKVLGEILDENSDPYNGTAVIQHMHGLVYKSALGYMIYMDENGDAEGNYTILMRKPLHGNTTEYGLFPVGIYTRQSNSIVNLPDVIFLDEIEWPNGSPPVCEPQCGFKNERCISHMLEILATISGVCFLVILAILFVVYRNWKYEQELDSLLWKVDYKEIEMNDSDNNGNSNKISKALHPFVRTSQISLSSNPDADFRYSGIYASVGIYKGRVFAVKKIKKKSIDITREMKKELKVMKDLRHDNLNSFIGACTDPPNICIVTEYCSRGSLKDILENEEVKLDNMFVSSLVGDILRGILFLHESPVVCHGNLKPSNCLVDSRWVLKLADFGLHEFKKDGDDYPHHFLQHDASQRSSLDEGALQNYENDGVIKCKCDGLLYRAPELLRDCPSYITGTQKGDVYSFSIILYEMNGRQGPFGPTLFSISEILEKIVRRDSLQLFRPPLELLENSFDFVRECLTECWAENPEERPDFKAIRNKLRPMRKGMKPNIFDNMMAMMEKYANNLEVLVDERTDLLAEEKRKTDALLHEMLPRTVAEQLKRGHKVDPESFDSVTIYFSDIVGFTAMSAESTPLQVVDFLNDLYTCFDSIIENYDVYKVETIGDAYMVVSGLPIKNGDMHAAEIATMSLHLLEEVKKFRMRHRPYDNLMLRVGIHSGPVCAGVVGLKMPRYCLFGDTVNTASRMESTGAPLKIHCSGACKALLDRLGGYSVVKRGFIGMKGKGEVMTYWLVGEDNHYKDQRYEERARRRTQHRRESSSKKKILKSESISGPRSSLKNSTQCPRAVSRCVSLDTPKKLRFANGNVVECNTNPYHKCSHEPLEIFPEVGKRRPSKVPEVDEYQGDLSVSCPCIELNFSAINNGRDNNHDSEVDASASEPMLCLTSSIPRMLNVVTLTENPFEMANHRGETDANTPLLQCTAVV